MTEQTNRNTNPDLPEAAVGRMSGGAEQYDQPAPVTSQTVFTAAGETPTKRRLSRSVCLGLAVAGILTGAALVRFSMSLAAPQSPAPPTAAEPERSAAQQPLPAQRPAEEPVALRDRKAAAETATPETKTATEEATDDLSAERGAEEAAEKSDTVGENSAVDADSATGRRRPSAGVAMETGEIRVARSEATEKKDNLSGAAYRACQTGAPAGARSGHEKRLQTCPDNRDARPGRAACEVNEGGIGAAVDIYARLLRSHPHEALPAAALIDLQRSEAAIRSLLPEQPDNPCLHFILGRLQAARLRWPEAQQAFFDAHRIDSANPVYALNLAISLDRMGQSETALDYYRTAVSLARQGAPGPDMEAVIRRINSLSRQARP